MITISCLCGAAQQTVSPPPHDSNSRITFCHCDSCRHLTGILCTTYTPTTQPSLAGLTKYSLSDTSARYFCSTCGCHVFRHSPDNGWAVATGTITSSPLTKPPQIRHRHVPDDGGLSIWLPNSIPPEPTLSQPTAVPFAALHASCHCARITFTITRPSRASTLPHSNYADLLIPYHNNPSSITTNPLSVKWWLRDPSPNAQPPSTDAFNHPSSQTLQAHTDKELSRYKYLAGTCACRSCRLASGFEIQTWTFVPRANILMAIPSSAVGGADLGTGTAKATVPLDFSALPPGLLRSYRSSTAAVREFCPTCGATVFWHDFERPDLIDVSVGLLRCPSGARAESFLQWWTQRTSFSEESRVGRTGGIANWADDVINTLEKGMQHTDPQAVTRISND
ncbi:Mss4-like protein [Podospora aff. communis PSN243]|uniref:Mss4-like protein n=1 Tax=Podospora aff. communis PSN243 TaxID=3040156 RepID=A0AAV9G9C5_9PEZI|nr:Mss4-like protein [Podospora aff. communis PSN243]